MKKMGDGNWGFTPTESMLLNKIGKLTKERNELTRRINQIDGDMAALSRTFALLALDRDVCPRCGGALIASTGGDVSCMMCGREITAVIQEVKAN